MAILANAVEPEPALPDVAAVLRWFEATPDRAQEGGLSLGVLRACLDHAARRAALHRQFLRELREREDGPVVEIPQRPGGVRNPEEADEMAEAVESALLGGTIA